MNGMKLRSTVAAVSGVLLLGFGASAMANSNEDLLNTLIAKGYLTEEEGKAIAEVQQKENKQMKSAGKIHVADFIDNATFYGDIRARYEYREGEDAANLSERRERGRYKLTLGMKTSAGDFYSDIALAMGAGGRSDNATFGSTNGANNKETVYIKRAMLGWKMTDWLAVEAGRVANPLFTTPMVWDGDLTFEGLVEKVNYKMGDVTLFGNFAQSQYKGDRKDFSIDTSDSASNNLLAFQGGAKFDLTKTVSAKAALTFTKFTNDHAPGASTFVPGLGNGTSLGTNPGATNDITTIEVPLELAFKLNDGMKLTAFSDYVKNIDGDDRFDAAVAAGGANAAAIRAAGKDDKAWLLGVGFGKSQGKTAMKGDWSAKIWYQDVGVYALDPNAVDSDFMDSRINMKGVVFKGEYLLRDNVYLNLAAGHGSRKNDDLAAVGTGGDIALNLDSFNLYQADITYKF